MKLHKFHIRLPRTIKDLQRKSEHFLHLFYLGASAWGLEGIHAYAAGGLFFVVLAGLFLHESEV